MVHIKNKCQHLFSAADEEKTVQLLYKSGKL